MHLRMFISSPGDVAEERTLARQVIEQELPKDPLLRGRITCEALSWDDPNAPVAMPARLTPQEAVNQGLAKPSDCDFVVVILWSRMGTPLPESYRKSDGSRYVSGTEWEFLDALSAQRPPHILVYRRTAKINIDPFDPEFLEKGAQSQQVKKFFETTFQNEDGSLRGAYTEYVTPQQFEEHLLSDLRAFVQKKLEAPPKPHRSTHPPYAAIARALAQGAGRANHRWRRMRLGSATQCRLEPVGATVSAKRHRVGTLVCR